MDYKNIIVSTEDGVAVVKLNRPESLNALNAELIAELKEAFTELTGNEDIRAVIITGEKNFAAGADVTSMVEFTPDEARAFTFSPTFNKIVTCPKPVIAAIEGFALGGGMELALTCDIRVAAPGAKMGFPEINLGIFPGAGGTQRLPRLIGSSRAKKMIFTGAAMKGEAALECGLVDVVADDPFDEAMKLAKELAAKAPVALKLAKECVNRSEFADMEYGLEFEAETWASLFDTSDQKEGMRAFLEKRKAEFTGK